MEQKWPRRGQWHRAKARQLAGELKHKPPDPNPPPPSPSMGTMDHDPATPMGSGRMNLNDRSWKHYGPTSSGLVEQTGQNYDDQSTTKETSHAPQSRGVGLWYPLWVLLKILATILDTGSDFLWRPISVRSILTGCWIWAILFGAWPMIVFSRPGSAGRLDDPDVYKFCNFVAPNACDELKDNPYWMFPLLTWGNIRKVSEAYDIGTSLVGQIDAQLQAISDLRERHDRAAEARRKMVLQWVTSTPYMVFNVTKVVADQARTTVHDLGNGITVRISAITSELISLTYAGHNIVVDEAKFFLEFGVNFTVGTLDEFHESFRQLYEEYDSYLTESALPKHSGRMAMALATADKRFAGLYLSHILMGFSHQDLAERMVLRARAGGRTRTIVPQISELEIPIRALVQVGYDPGGIARAIGFSWDPGATVS